MANNPVFALGISHPGVSGGGGAGTITSIQQTMPPGERPAATRYCITSDPPFRFRGIACAGPDFAQRVADSLNSGRVQPDMYGWHTEEYLTGLWWVIDTGDQAAPAKDGRWNGRCVLCSKGTFTLFTSIEHEDGGCSGR